MSKSEKYLVMCVGHSHSGKTTFARKLKKATRNTIVIDNDDIALFINRTYPEVALSKFNYSKRTFKDPNFKFVLYQYILDFSLRSGLNIILSNGNLANDIRSIVKRKARRYGYTLITLYFNFSENVLIERAKESRKNPAVFMQAKDWLDVLRQQKKYAELPPSKKNTIYFEITSASDFRNISRRIQKMLETH
ncbi:MAG TPA: ATP-binding protein [Candidatus Paceibacterota bacterium]